MPMAVHDTVENRRHTLLNIPEENLPSPAAMSLTGDKKS